VAAPSRLAAFSIGTHCERRGLPRRSWCLRLRFLATSVSKPDSSAITAARLTRGNRVRVFASLCRNSIHFCNLPNPLDESGDMRFTPLSVSQAFTVLSTYPVRLLVNPYNLPHCNRKKAFAILFHDCLTPVFPNG
jgi:hypothetical protein